MEAYFETRNLSVGYDGKPLIRDINVKIEKGKILTLIGPNGAGKSTILKSIIKNIEVIDGDVLIGSQKVSDWSVKEMARQVAVVLTERIRPELMTCAQVVAMGRYPYTNMVGRLTNRDKEAVENALRRVHAMDLANQDFMTTSDGQKQRILLARAICQEPEVIVLDEPTAYLDIRHKVEFLDILRSMAREKGITVIMSLHEVDLAAKISDYLMCVRGETIQAFGTPEKILRQGSIETLYDMDQGSFNLLFGSVELAKQQGAPEAFVIAGNGRGIPIYRELQKKQIPFAAGILFENDVDWQVASALSDHVISVPAFEEMTRKDLERALEVMKACRYVVDAGTEIRSGNRLNGELLRAAKDMGLPVYQESGR